MYKPGIIEFSPKNPEEPGFFQIKPSAILDIQNHQKINREQAGTSPGIGNISGHWEYFLAFGTFPKSEQPALTINNKVTHHE